MYVVCKTVIGKEYMRSKSISILCKSENQAESFVCFMNNNNERSMGDFQLKDGECYHMYILDNYDYPPQYKLKVTKGKISVVSL